jgi:energy-coupling factor transporter ATP-binding protein EcfA2
MAERIFLSGPNFSGRSQALRTALRRAPFKGTSFFLGPYAEAALSGLSNTLGDEVDIYRADNRLNRRPLFAPLDFDAYIDRKPQTLSGGEQVLLALHCFSVSPHDAIAIDTALEQLDTTNRNSALQYIKGDDDHGFSAALIDNRIDEISSDWKTIAQPARKSDYACDLPGLAKTLFPHRAPTVALQDLDFSYRNGKTIFRDVNITLLPSNAYRLLGPNGAGKTTLLKILVGVLPASRGRISLDGNDYEPGSGGNRAFALATQNPDHQWCGVTLREDIMRRRSNLAAYSKDSLPSDDRVALLSEQLGIRSLDMHLYEIPLAARKRLSWLWSFSGAAPWIMLDEPTVGQDRDTRAQLAFVIGQLCTLGYGIIFVTHDDEFAAGIAHRTLAIADRKITIA